MASITQSNMLPVRERLAVSPNEQAVSFTPHRVNRKKFTKGKEAKKSRLNGLSYKQYLDSCDWKILRKQCLKRDHYLCLCGKKAWQVHHKKYPPNNQWWLDHLGNLEASCGECHQLTHGLKKPDVPWQWRY